MLTMVGCVCAASQGDSYRNGVSLIQLGRHAEAIPYLQSATKEQPQRAPGWNALGVAYAAQGMYDLAEPAFHQACSLDAKLEDACYYEGRALYALDRFEASIDVLRRAATVAPGSWKIELGIAQAMEGLGKAVDAERRFQRSCALARNADAQPHVALGLFLVRQGRPGEAINLLQETLRRFPGDPGAQTQLGRALLEQGRFSEAVPVLESAVKSQPASAQLHLLLAKAYVRLGRNADAQPHFEAARN